jgi:hypothetical protein
LNEVFEMNVSDNDLDLLETYLDGELPVADAEDLWRRLAAEPPLAAALDELRAERSDRLSVWESLEPSDAKITKISQRVKSATRRQDLIDWSLRGLQYTAAIAACLMFAIAGWSMRGNFTTPTGPIAVTPGRIEPVGGPLQMVSHADDKDTQGDTKVVFHPAPVLVNVQDGFGRQAIQTFGSLKEANDFVNYVNQPRQTSPGASPIVPVSDEQQRF